MRYISASLSVCGYDGRGVVDAVRYGRPGVPFESLLESIYTECSGMSAVIY
jgi:hypothetical protein